MTTDHDDWEEFVASLEEDDVDDGDSDSSRRVGEGPPVKSLAWPTPTLYQAELIVVRAYDHRSNSIRTVENVLVKKTRATPDKAYLIRKKISKTTFGSVRMGVVLYRRSEDELDAEDVPWISSEELFCVKVSSWKKIKSQIQGQTLEDPVREVAALQLVGNSYPHIVGCHEVLQDAKHLYTIMPYYSQGTNLHGRLFSDESTHGQGGGEDQTIPPSSPNEDEARTIFRQLLKGLLQLRRKGIHHRDISLDNLLISKTNQLKIVDLGMSLRVPYNDPCNEGCITDVSEGTVRRLIKKQGKGGRLMYLAPEIIAEKEGFDGFAVDLWAAGVILFVLCVGLAPFKFAEPSDKRYAKISSGGLKSLMQTLKISLTPEACDLLQNMLWEDPRHRLSLMEVMKHPWVMGDCTIDSSNGLLRVISSEASVGSLSSTEPTQDTDNESLKTASQSPKPDPVAVNPETREAASESSRDTFVEAAPQRWARNLQQIGPKLRANAQQVGPRIMNNAQRIGPKLKNAVANVQIQRPKSIPLSNNGAGSNNQPSPSTPNPSPTRRSSNTPQFFSRLKTVIPNKSTTSATSSPTTPV